MGNPSCEIPNSRKDFFYEISIFILRNNLSGISWDWFSSSELFRTNFYPSESSQWISRDWFFTFGIMLMKFSTFRIILAGFHEMKLLHFGIILLSHRIYRDQTVENQWITEVPFVGWNWVKWFRVSVIHVCYDNKLKYNTIGTLGHHNCWTEAIQLGMMVCCRSNYSQCDRDHGHFSTQTEGTASRWMDHGRPKLQTIADEAQHHFAPDHCTTASVAHFGPEAHFGLLASKPNSVFHGGPAPDSARLQNLQLLCARDISVGAQVGPLKPRFGLQVF
jgi:hypothetical protein